MSMHYCIFAFVPSTLYGLICFSEHLHIYPYEYSHIEENRKDNIEEKWRISEVSPQKISSQVGDSCSTEIYIPAFFSENRQRDTCSASTQIIEWYP